MSALDERWADVDPETLADAALEAKRCECMRPIVDKWRECVRCGREVRSPGSLAREFRVAAYMRRLSWAAGAGLSRREGFKGLSYQLGPNPELTTLDAALSARVQAPVAVEGDPFADPELIPSLIAA